MARVLLISPASRKSIIGWKEFGPPLGLEWIASSLNNDLSDYHHEIEIIDSVGIDINHEEVIKEENDTFIRYGLALLELGKKISNFNPDIVGISVHATPHWKEAIAIVNLCKEINPKIITVLGGPHPSACYEYLLKKYWKLDFIILREGELSFKLLVEYLERNKFRKTESEELRKIPNMAFRPRENTIFVSHVDFIKDINILPLPALDKIDLSPYNINNSDFYCYGKSLSKKWHSVSLSRGCPFNCDFCFSSFMEGRKIRSLNVNKVKDYLTMLEKLDISDICIEDNNFLRNPYLSDILSILKQKRIRFNIINGVDPILIDSELINKLNNCGCYRVYFPFETGNPKLLKEYKYGNYNLDTFKKLIQRNKQNVHCLVDNGIEVVIGIMIGFPNESIEQIRISEEIAIEVFNIDREMIKTLAFCVTPFPGTELYNYCKKNKLLFKRYDWMYKPEYYYYDRAKIGRDIEYLKQVERERIKIIYNANNREYAHFLAGGKSWQSYKNIEKDIKEEFKIE